MATFVVTTTADAGAGSLRDAIDAANLNPGADDIHFNIGSGLQTIAPLSSLPTVTDAVTIDGSTQPGFAGSPIIEISGALAGGGANGLTISASNSVVRGLIVNRFDGRGVHVAGSDNIIVGNWIGLTAAGDGAAGNGTGVFITGARNLIGGTTAADRNVISASTTVGIGVFISGVGATDNVVSGNYIGLNAAGTGPLGNRTDGVRVQIGTISNFIASRNTIGGAAAGAGNVVAGNGSEGITIVFTTDCTVQGNYSGTDATGTVAFGNNIGIFLNRSNDCIVEGNLVAGNRNNGISMLGTSGNQILNNVSGLQSDGVSPLGNRLFGINVNTSSNTVVQGNIVCDNGSGGIFLTNTGISPFIAANNVIQGNRIGITATGAAVGNRTHGIQVGLITSGPNLTNNLIGGTSPGDANIIAFNAQAGIFANAGTGTAIRRNSIHSNGLLGIDLLPPAPNPNDPGDPDTGPNNLQNFPVLTATANQGGGTQIDGTLNSTPNTTFIIEFFDNAVADPSGHGEGEIFIGDTTVTTDGAGNASFSVSFPTVPLTHFISATATDPSGNTSEFSGSSEVVQGNTAPVALDDSYTVGQDSTLTTTDEDGAATVDPNDNGVLANDVDLDGDDLDVAQITDAPDFGTLSIDQETGTFTYTPNTGFFGTDTFRYIATDGQVDSNEATVTITVTAAPPGSIVLIPDACHPGETALIVNGTPGDDNIHIAPASSGGVEVFFSGASQGTFNPTGRIIVFGYTGNDTIQLAGSLPNEAWLYGDSGDDRLNLSNGGGIAFGGDGNDYLLGGSARDILVGGDGSDRVIGNSGDDILIAAMSIYDDRFVSPVHEAAWCAIHHEWTRTDHTYQERVDNIRDGSGTVERDNGPFFLNSTTVLDDGDEDLLTGAAAHDWFFASLDGPGVLDKITDLKNDEYAEELLP